MDISILDNLGKVKKIQKKVQGMKLGKCEIESISKDSVTFIVTFNEAKNERVVVTGFSAA